MNHHLGNESKETQLIPTLETDRLILSKHEVSDFTALTQLWANTSMVQHIGGKP
ncbi:GNAT family N-acetyltransferase, partial [Bacillus subtilis]